ncbi:hypothetical protein [Hymenobacter coccineus]|nr:hypothetical protein [Hymenobacter coccineus]
MFAFLPRRAAGQALRQWWGPLCLLAAAGCAQKDYFQPDARLPTTQRSRR